MGCIWFVSEITGHWSQFKTCGFLGWLPGWGSHLPDNLGADHIGCSRFSERRNTGKLLFSSLILEGRRIFDLKHRGLSKARLTISIGYICLFPLQRQGTFFVWIYFVIQTHLWHLSCLYLEVFRGTSAKIQRVEVIVGDYIQTYVTMPCFELLFWNFLKAMGECIHRRILMGVKGGLKWSF